MAYLVHNKWEVGTDPATLEVITEKLNKAVYLIKVFADTFGLDSAKSFERIGSKITSVKLPYEYKEGYEQYFGASAFYDKSCRNSGASEVELEMVASSVLDMAIVEITQFTFNTVLSELRNNKFIANYRLRYLAREFNSDILTGLKYNGSSISYRGSIPLFCKGLINSIFDFGLDVAYSNYRGCFIICTVMCKGVTDTQKVLSVTREYMDGVTNASTGGDSDNE
jgi:hypothetical protein